ALYQPDIAPNVGTLMRMGACLGVKVNIIEPCGFPFGAKDLRRSAMDYAKFSDVERHSSFEAFLSSKKDKRLILLTTKASVPYVDFKFRESDILLLGQESSGVPEEVHKIVDGRVTIPMQQGMRSVNVAIAAAIVTGEALRQTATFPTFTPEL
ncbi:MAG: tRNA (cytidine(34)-2'-O)-methyltransferase, partial [Sneathiellales bacterium]|nr:tRNA (cytidine(34)-2'-O)-methyltransferase [Sneathiellales bacterium]